MKGQDQKTSYAHLLELAIDANKKAYAPYLPTSNGAALLAADGRITIGFSIQLPTVGSSVCAAKASIIKAVLEGAREFSAIAIAGNGVDSNYLCGSCRQFLSEFSLDVDVITERNPTKIISLRELLPEPFSGSYLRESHALL